MKDRNDTGHITLAPPPGKPAAESPALSENGPVRSCIVSGQSLQQSSMIRFALDPDGTVTPDIDRKLPGRGYWVSAIRSTLEKASRPPFFNRAARREVKIPDNLMDLTEKLLRKRCLSLIGLACGAGQGLSGYEKIMDILRSGKAGVYVTASSPGTDSRTRLESLHKGRPVIDFFTVGDLSDQLGRDNVTHMVLLDGPLCDRFLEEAARLQGILAEND